MQLGIAAHNGYPGISLNRPDYSRQRLARPAPFDWDEGFYVASAERPMTPSPTVGYSTRASRGGVVLAGLVVWARDGPDHRAALGAAVRRRNPVLAATWCRDGRHRCVAVPGTRGSVEDVTPVVHLRVLDLGPWIGQVDFGPEWACHTAGLG